MKKLYTFCLSLIAISASAQMPTMFGTEAEDGILYQEYPLIDHGAVSSVRFMAQNDIPAGDAQWQFFTGDYFNNWRPYTTDDTISGYNAVIDPSVETASARFNSNYGGQPGRLQAIQAGYYYTAIVQNGMLDNQMSIVETDFAPVAIDTIIISPENPTVQDDITVTVELDGAATLSPGEHVFLRVAGSPDFTVGPAFNEVVNFANGVGTLIIPAGTVPAGVTVYYYGLVTNQPNPQHETIDYFTLFFENNGGANFQFSVSGVTVGIEDAMVEYGITQVNGQIDIRNAEEIEVIELLSIDGKVVGNKSAVGSTASLEVSNLPSGIYVLNLYGKEEMSSVKLFID